MNSPRINKEDGAIKALVMQSTGESYYHIDTHLRAMGIETTVAESTRQAISRLETDANIHLIVADALMPRDGAFQLLKTVKESPRFQWFPIAMTSMSWDQNTVRQSLDLGADAILALPMEERVFQSKISQLLADGRRVVLVVDDEDTILSYMTMILEFERFVVRTASSSVEALEIVKSEPVHVVISDVMMPGMNGLDLMVEIKKAHDHIPVVLITGFTGKFTAEGAIAAGADAYFKKPFKNTELVSTIRRIVRNDKSDRIPAASA